jgi:hypothetical protein
VIGAEAVTTEPSGASSVYQTTEEVAGTVTVCPLTVMVCGEDSSSIWTVLTTPGRGSSPKVAVLTVTVTVDDPAGGEKVIGAVHAAGLGEPTGSP